MLLVPTVGPLEIAIVALVVILLFGVGKLSGLGKDLGSSIKEFRHAMKDGDDDQNTSQPTAAQQHETLQATQPVQPARVQPVKAQPQQQPGQDSDRPNLF